jgi:uncharacterized protein (DUF433 family)
MEENVAMATVDTSPAYAFQTPQGGWRVTGSRVSLDSVVHAHKEGFSPEQIVADFPSLSLEQVYGAIAFYLHNKDAIEDYLRLQEKAWETLRQESAKRHPELLRRIREFREQQAIGHDAT